MARLVVEEDDVVVRLSWREKGMTGCRNVRVPLTAVKDAKVEPDWWRAVRGERRRGRRSPGRFCLGEWRHRDGLDFVAVHVNTPVVCVDLWRSAPFARLSVSATDAEEAARSVQELRAALRRPTATAASEPTPRTPPERPSPGRISRRP
ncbi:hypothetical protein [Streptomyces sp. NPDC002845]